MAPEVVRICPITKEKCIGNCKPKSRCVMDVDAERLFNRALRQIGPRALEAAAKLNPGSPEIQLELARKISLKVLDELTSSLKRGAQQKP